MSVTLYVEVNNLVEVNRLGIVYIFTAASQVINDGFHYQSSVMYIHYMYIWRIRQSYDSYLQEM